MREQNVYLLSSEQPRPPGTFSLRQVLDHQKFDSLGYKRNMRGGKLPGLVAKQRTLSGKVFHIGSAGIKLEFVPREVRSVVC